MVAAVDSAVWNEEVLKDILELEANDDRGDLTGKPVTISCSLVNILTYNAYESIGQVTKWQPCNQSGDTSKLSKQKNFVEQELPPWTQIMYAHGHYILLHRPDRDNVLIFDSSQNSRDHVLKKAHVKTAIQQLCGKEFDDKKVHVMDCALQPDSVSCGVFCLIWFSQLVLAQWSPQQVADMRFGVKKQERHKSVHAMRAHLLKCLDDGKKLTPFQDTESGN